MDKNTKITLAELIKRKEQVLEAKKSPKKARIYVKSLDGEIIIKAPTKSLATEAAEMENDGDAHLMNVLPSRIYIQRNFKTHTVVHIPKKLLKNSSMRAKSHLSRWSV